MSIAERHLHVASRPLELDALERGRDGVRIRLAVLRCLFIRHLQAQQRLRHLIGRIGRRNVVSVGIDLLEPFLHFGVAGERTIGTPTADDRALRHLVAQPPDCRFTRGHDDSHALVEAAGLLLIDEGFEVTVIKTGVKRL